jgi:hypothetical protein
MSIQQFPAPDNRFNPIETLVDPVNKLRVSQPEALIDTDFEYGIQQSKWENLAATNNRPFAYPTAAPLRNVSLIEMPSESKVVTITLGTRSATVTGAVPSSPEAGDVTYTTSSSHLFVAGEYVTITGSSIAGYNGTFKIDQVPTATTFTVINSTTGTETWSSGLAVGGVAPPNGTPISVQDTFISPANGNFLIETGGGTGTFTYFGKAQNKTVFTVIYDPNKTSVFVGNLYSDARIGGAPTISTSGLEVTVTTTVPHGLSIGNTIGITGITGTNPPNGSYLVSTVATPTTFVYYADPTEGTPSGLTTTGASVYVRPQAQFLHRPFDGGVIFSANATSNYEQAIRQTRRYFRYQSGKGLQVSSGTILKPYSTVDGLTSAGPTATVTTKEQHNLAPGTQIIIEGANEEVYNGSFTVEEVTGFNSFTYTLPDAATSPATGIISLNVDNWYGGSAKLGAFDSQNGLFWEFDGQTLYVARRSSTQQLSGRSTVTQGSNVVTRTSPSFPTSYSSQMKPGDYVVIRGQSYRVIAIDDLSTTPNFTISPSYRGASAEHVTVSLTVDLKIPQSEFNLDKADGTGPSGYNVDLTKMQMFYIDYSWYGAGFIRWGLRGPSGDVFYVHKMPNNNVNNEAYMRSGNLPARYETVTTPPTTRIEASISDSATDMSVLSTEGFPDSGTLIIKPSTTDNEAGLLSEYVNYTGKTATTFTGLTRGKAGASGVSSTWTIGINEGTVASATGIQIGQRVTSTVSPNPVPDGTYVTGIAGTVITLNQALTGTNPPLIFAPMGATSGKAYTYSASAPISVELAYPTFSPTISHWGTSMIMDGQYDDDASLVFTYGQTNGINIPARASRALFSIRLAPSIDNGTSANFGQRELINRMQLKLNTIGVSTASSGLNYLVRLYLNAVPSRTVSWGLPTAFEPGTGNSSLAQIADYSTIGVVGVSGGEIVGGFLSQGTDSIFLADLRDLGNCILGGGGENSQTGFYPDGPDTITVVVTNLGTSGTAGFLGRLSWTEAQA